MWISRSRIRVAAALAGFAACALDPVAANRSAAAQRPDTTSDELVEAILRYAFRYDGANARLVRGRVPEDLTPNFHVPPGTRVLGSVVTGSGVLVLATSAAPPESLRAEYTRVLGARGWKPLGSMRHGGFVESAPQMPLVLCRDGANLQVTAARRSSTSSDLVLNYRDGTGPCEPPRAAAVRGMMPDDPKFPTLFAPPAPDELRMRCFSRLSSGSRSSIGTSTRVPAAMSAEEVLRHYARQIEAEGWRTGASSGLATAVGTWTRSDSTGTNELKLEVREMPGTSGIRCYEVRMNVSGDGR